MENNHEKYRANLARQLKAETDKTRRRDLVRSARGSHEYTVARAANYRERFDKRQIRRLAGIVEKADGIETLKQSILATPMFIRSRPKLGDEHSEHLLKQIDMAERLRCGAVVSEAGGLRAKVSALLESNGITFADHVDPDLYKEFLQERFANYGLTDNEADMVAGKITPYAFASLDREIEAAIVLLDAVPATRTTRSCAGHLDYAGEHIDDSAVYIGYIRFSTEDQNLINDLRTLQAIPGIEHALEQEDAARFRLSFEKIVPDAWKETHPLADDESAELKRSREDSEAIVYREYFTSPQAERDKRNFIDALTERINQYRLSRKAV